MDINIGNELSRIFDLIMINFKCCGIYGQRDFDKEKNIWTLRLNEMSTCHDLFFIYTYIYIYIYIYIYSKTSL